MKKIEVELEGITPLLMNSPKGMLELEDSVKNKMKKYVPEEEAEKVAYRDNNGKLYVPATAIKGCMINAAAYKKIGKYALRPFIAGQVRVLGDKIILNKQEYEIDLRTVVIQRNRVIRVRPKIEDWKLNFILECDETTFADTTPVKVCLEEGGQRIGLLDFAPRNKGSFGMFKVSKFKEVK